LTLLKELLGSMNMAVIMSLHELDLAQRISDKVVCIKDGHVDKCGTPEDVFTNGYIAALYGLDEGSFDCRYCSPEICNAKKPPEVFVIGGNGSGIDVFRILNRRGIPFAAGMIPANDIDYPAAASLASELLSFPAFEDADEKDVERAKKIMDSCGKVICSRSTFGKYDIANRELYGYAKEKGYLCNNLIFPE
ncbi:MAG: ABC transporter ATP-binding protein, partial [Huintestinicola sp.]